MKTTKKTLYVTRQIGGKKLDQGGFSCVVSPHVSCFPKKTYKILTSNLKKKNKSKPKSKDKYISKLLFTNLDSSDITDFQNELKIYNKLIKIDPNSNYFIIPIDICYLEKISSNRKDIKFIKYYKDIYGEIDYDYIIKNGRKTKIYKEDPVCYLDKALHPINMIFPYAGVSFTNLSNNNFIRQIFKYIFYHLCQAIQLLHHNHIVHSDIKPDNIMCNPVFLTKKNIKQILNNKNYTPLNFIKLIDFGLSNIISKSNIFKYNLIYSYYGTETFISPEMIIAYNLHNYSHQELISDMKQFIKDYIELNMESYLNLNISNIKENITRIQNYIDNNTYESLFIEPINGFIYKSDIYALGISMIMIAEDFNIKITTELKDLLQKMTDFNPITRLNIDQVLNHPYFIIK